MQLPINDNEPNLIKCSFTLSEHYFRTIDQAGQTYQNIISFGKRKPEDVAATDDIDDDVSDVSDHSQVQDKQDEDQQELLGLKQREMVASQDEIKKAQYKLSLKYHPDKIKNLVETDEKEFNEASEIFIKIQKAQECLSDPIKKKRQDATLPFDDGIPEHWKTAEMVAKKTDKFQEEFHACFERNSIQSKETPVPMFGGAESDLEGVSKFQEFWFGFKTWRDFKVEDEQELESAENAFEKREMMKENKRLKKTRVKDEQKRVQKLVQLAYNLDPRVKQLKILEQEQRLEAKRLDRELKMKEKMEHEKKMKANMVNLKPISSITKPEKPAEQAVDSEDAFLIGIEFDERWTMEELNQLQKSLRLIPAGTKDRQLQVHKDIIKQGAKKDRKQLQSKISEFQEILKSGGNLIEMMKKSAQKPEEEKKEENEKVNAALDQLEKGTWNADETKKLKDGLKLHADIKDPKEKFQKIAEYIGTKNYKDCIQKVKAMQNKTKK